MLKRIWKVVSAILHSISLLVAFFSIGRIADLISLFEAAREHGLIEALRPEWEGLVTIVGEYPDAAFFAVIGCAILWWMFVTEPKRREELRLQEQRRLEAKRHGRQPQQSKRKRKGRKS